MSLDRAGKALADRNPSDLDCVTRLERLDRNRVTDCQLGVAAELHEMTVGRRAGLLQVAKLALRDLAVSNGLVGELHGGVPVGGIAPDMDDRARTGLDHSDGCDAPGLGIEDLRHPKLFPNYAFHDTPPKDGEKALDSAFICGFWIFFMVLSRTLGIVSAIPKVLFRCRCRQEDRGASANRRSSASGCEYRSGACGCAPRSARASPCL